MVVTSAPKDSESRVEVCFREEKEKKNIKNLELPTTLVSTKLSRRGLSRILNVLLQNPQPVPYDFFVWLNEDSASTTDGRPVRIHLKTSLTELMTKYGLTSETRLTLTYEVCCYSTVDRLLSQETNWLLGVCHRFKNKTEGLLIAAYSNGTCKFCPSQLYQGNELSILTGDIKYQFSNIALTGVDTFITPDNSMNQFVTTDSSGSIFFGKLLIRHQDQPHIEITFKDKSLYGSLNRCRLNEDGNIVAAAGSDGKIYLWDAKRVYETEVHEISHEKTNQMDDISYEKNLKKRSRDETKQEQYRLSYLSGHRASVNSICFVPFKPWNAQLVSASSDQTVRLWDLSSFTSVATWSVVCSATSVTAHPDATIFATSHDDGRLRIWDVRCSSPVSNVLDSVQPFYVAQKKSDYHIHRRTVSEVCWNPYDENVLASVSHDGCLKVVDLRYSGFARNTSSYPNLKLMCLDWIERCNLISGGSDGCLRQHIFS